MYHSQFESKIRLASKFSIRLLIEINATLTSPAAAIQFHSHTHSAQMTAAGNDADARSDDGRVDLSCHFRVRIRVTLELLQPNRTRSISNLVSSLPNTNRYPNCDDIQ